MLFLENKFDTMKNILLGMLIIFSLTTYSQTKHSYITRKSDSIDFCKPADNLIGKKFKIYHNGGVYSNANGEKSTAFDWEDDKVKITAGKSHWGNYEPQTGEIGELVQIRKTKYNDIVYILKINEHYVPVGCWYIIQASNLSEDELYKERWDKVFAYGDGACNFKKYGFNDVGNRAGIFDIDRLSEKLACDLKTRGIDTVMLVKKIYDDGSTPNEMAFVFWIENEKNYRKIFKNNEDHNPTESEIEEYEWTDILRYYNEKVKGTEIIFPDYTLNHFTNLIVQLYQKDEFYSFGMQLLIHKKFEELPNVKFIRYLENRLDIKDRDRLKFLTE